MAESWTVADALAELSAVGVPLLAQPMAALRSAMADLADGIQAIGIAAPPRSAGGPDSPRPPFDPFRAGRDSSTTDGAGNWLDNVGNGLRMLLEQAAAPLPPDGPGLGDLAGLAASSLPAQGPDQRNSQEEEQTQLLRQNVDLQQALLDLAQGPGIKVDSSGAVWG
jgi:hypothetical protein